MGKVDGNFVPSDMKRTEASTVVGNFAASNWGDNSFHSQANGIAFTRQNGRAMHSRGPKGLIAIHIQRVSPCIIHLYIWAARAASRSSSESGGRHRDFLFVNLM